MLDAPLAYAFTAGMVATVNPCGFPMLPAYLSYFIGGAADEVDREPTPVRVLRAVGAALAVSAGFFAVFVGLGIPINAGRTWLYEVMPWVTIVIGAGLVALGIAMLMGHPLKVSLPRLDKGGRSRRVGSMALFGISYAIASLSCTLPVFLLAVAGTSKRESFAAGVATFVAFSAGMSLVLVVLSVGLALAQGSLVHQFRKVLPYVDRIAGTLLVAVGAYLVFYWTLNLRSDPADPVRSGPIVAVERWARTIESRLQDGGVELLGIVFALVVAGAVSWALLRRRQRRAA